MLIPGADLYAFWCPDHYWKLDWWGFPLSSQFPVTVENKKQQNIGVTFLRISTFSFSFLVCLATSSIVFDERGLLTIIRFSWCRQLNILQISPEICPQYPCIRRGYFFYFEDTVNPLLSPPRAYLFQSLLKGGLMEMGGGGGGGIWREVGGLIYLPKFGTILNFQATRGWYQFSTKHKAYVERGIAAERSKQIRTSSIWIKHDTTVISPSLIKLVGKNKDGSALCVWRCVNQLVMWLTMIDVTNGVTDGATDHVAIVITS